MKEELSDALHEGYTTENNYYWICGKCFEDFKDPLASKAGKLKPCPIGPAYATAAVSASRSYSPNRTLIFLLTPRVCIVIPSSTSAMLIVRLA